MMSNVGVTSIKRLPEDVRTTIAEIIGEVHEGDAEEIIGDIEIKTHQIRTNGVKPYSGLMPSEARKQYRRIRASVRDLFEAIDELDPSLVFPNMREAVERSLDFEPYGRELYDLGVWETSWPHDPFHELDTLCRDIRRLERICALLDDKLVRKGGRLPNARAQHVATDIAAVLAKYDIKLSSYSDGTFFRILESVFPAVIPGIKSNAYPRYGAEAVKRIANRSSK